MEGTVCLLHIVLNALYLHVRVAIVCNKNNYCFAYGSNNSSGSNRIRTIKTTIMVIVIIIIIIIIVIYMFSR